MELPPFIKSLLFLRHHFLNDYQIKIFIHG